MARSFQRGAESLCRRVSVLFQIDSVLVVTRARISLPPDFVLLYPFAAKASGNRYRYLNIKETATDDALISYFALDDFFGFICFTSCTADESDHFILSMSIDPPPEYRAYDAELQEKIISWGVEYLKHSTLCRSSSIWRVLTRAASRVVPP